MYSEDLENEFKKNKADAEQCKLELDVTKESFGNKLKQNGIMLTELGTEGIALKKTRSARWQEFVNKIKRVFGL